MLTDLPESSKVFGLCPMGIYLSLCLKRFTGALRGTNLYFLYKKCFHIAYISHFTIVLVSAEDDKIRK